MNDVMYICITLLCHIIAVLILIGHVLNSQTRICYMHIIMYNVG